MSNEVLPERFFYPPQQAEFWQALDPDVNKMLEACEQREDWVRPGDELPPLFAGLSNALPMVGMLPYGEGGDRLLHAFVAMLSAVPLRGALAGISWLDRQNLRWLAERGENEEDTVGWGVGLYLFAKQYGEAGQDDERRRACRLLCSRVELVMRTEVAVALFTHSDVWGGEESGQEKAQEAVQHE